MKLKTCASQSIQTNQNTYENEGIELFRQPKAGFQTRVNSDSQSGSQCFEHISAGLRSNMFVPAG